ncbi:hypothetical protein ACF07Y_42770 [Streptomyces sp. NPDC016566]|uniref:hypothetical protein n=1 Tax=Streptomyces sp. NPDC016566 TaxID=3364967 RepID=UPI0036F6850A
MPEPEAVPGFPRQFTDSQAAAAWRALSPPARREADVAMDTLLWAQVWHLQVAAETSTQLSGSAAPPTPQKRHEVYEREEDARDSLALFQHRLDELTARHALLMHGAVLVDIEHAARWARHRAVVAAQATLSPAGQPPRTDDAVLSEHDALMARVQAAQEPIGHALAEQRQMTRDALHRLYPTMTGSQGIEQLRIQLVDDSGLGTAHYTLASRELSDAQREHADLEARSTAANLEPGAAPVTEEEISDARARVERAGQNLTELTSSRTDTLRALQALRSVAELTPTPPGGVAARAQHLAAQSRQRAQTPTPTAERPHSGDRAAEQRQTPHQQAPRTGSSVRPT